MKVTYLGLPEGRYYSPAIVVNEYSKLVRSVGQEAVFSERKYQSDRELWIASLCALGMSCISKTPLWVGYGKDRAPDAEIVTLTESDALPGKGRDLDIINIEIMELDPHSHLSFEDELVKKLEKKYPSHFELLIFMNQSGTYSHDDLAKIAEKHNPRIGAIWVLGGDMKEMNLWKLHPSRQWVKYKPVKVANNLSNKDIISLKRGTGY